MSRHSKNNTGSSIFTYCEREQLKNSNEWGQVSLRLGSDSQKKFEQCNICLNVIVSPVICLKGHIYCKQCILENLLFQKNKNKKIIADWEKANQSKDEETNAKNSQMKIAQLKQIEESTETNGSQLEISIDPKAIPLYTNKNKAKEERRPTKNCFWLPEQTPCNKDNIKTKPQNILYCPSASKSHPIQFKELIDLNLFESKNDAHKGKYMCKVCEETLSIQKIVCLKECGHVMCYNCLKLVCSKKEQCSICNIKYSPSEIIILEESGTGYSRHNNVISHSLNPYFKY